MGEKDFMKGFWGIETGADLPLASFQAAMEAARRRRAAGGDPVEVVSFPGGWVVADPAILHVDSDGTMCLFYGHLYSSESSLPDATVFSESARAKGFEEALREINGDFSVAFWSPVDRRLLLARDRFGVKPLYYAGPTGGGTAFASRPSLLFDLPGVGRGENRAWTARFLTCHYRYIDNALDESPYERIAQLPGAHLFDVPASGAAPTIRRWWTIEDRPDLDAPEEELAEACRDLLLDAVRVRLRKARHPAFTLSGGMDSSSVLACAVRLTGEKQRAFSTVYDDKTYDESEDIRSILADCVSRWDPVLVENPDLFALSERMVRDHDEPVVTATWLSHHLLCERAAAEGCDSLFGGLGGDELNAGEYEHFFYRFADLRHQGLEDVLEREIDCWRRYHDHPIYRKNRDVVERFFGRCIDFSVPGRIRPEPERVLQFRDLLDPNYFDLSGFEPKLDRIFGSWLKNRTWQDLTRETLPCCLRAEDRNAVAFGLDHFDPFLDHRLVEFMFALPGELKIRDGVTKVLLRSAMRGILPEETRLRIKKTGWNAPTHAWFRRGDFASRLIALGDSGPTCGGVLKRDAVLDMLDRYAVDAPLGSYDVTLLLWQILSCTFFFRMVQSS
jgi:asparagine synthase (glutamine-hydrolysing)